MVASEVTSWVPWIVEIPSVSHDLVHVDSHVISAFEGWICYCHSSNSRCSKHYERDPFHEESRYFLCDFHHRYHGRISKIHLFSVQHWHVLCVCVCVCVYVCVYVCVCEYVCAYIYIEKEKVINRKNVPLVKIVQTVRSIGFGGWARRQHTLYDFSCIQILDASSTFVFILIILMKMRTRDNTSTTQRLFDVRFQHEFEYRTSSSGCSRRWFWRNKKFVRRSWQSPISTARSLSLSKYLKTRWFRHAWKSLRYSLLLYGFLSAHLRHVPHDIPNMSSLLWSRMRKLVSHCGHTSCPMKMSKRISSFHISSLVVDRNQIQISKLKRLKTVFHSLSHFSGKKHSEEGSIKRIGHTTHNDTSTS